MLIVFPFCTRDEELALSLAQWIGEMVAPYKHEFLCVYDRRCTRTQEIVGVLAKIGTTTPLAAAGEIDGWPAGANHLFGTAGKYLEMTRRGDIAYWMWLEPDVVPICATCFEEIEAAHLKGKRPFTGARVQVANVPVHMSGVGIYPNPLSHYAGQTYLGGKDIAFDMAGAGQIVSQANWTSLIVHNWDAANAAGTEPRTFNNQGELDNLLGQHKGMVLFHADKSGCAIDLLRQKTLPVQVPVTDKVEMQHPVAETHEQGTGGRPTFDVFIKTYPPDYGWLQLSLQSIHQHLLGFGQIIVVAPDDKAPVGSKETLLVKPEPNEPNFDGYLNQQIEKMYADMHSTSDFILHVDCDVIMRKCSLEDFISDWKAIWYYTPYEKTETPWKPITEKFLKRSVEFEFMRRAPQLIPRWLYPRIREWFYAAHGCSLEHYIKMQPYREFSEFNALGAYAYYFHREKFVWVNTEEGQLPPANAVQFRSYDGVNRSKVEAILGDGHQPPKNEVLQPADHAGITVDGSSPKPKKRKKYKMSKQGRANIKAIWTPEKREEARQRRLAQLKR